MRADISYSGLSVPIIAAVAAISCAPAEPVSEASKMSSSMASPFTPTGSTNETERKAFAKLVDEAYAVLQSPRFHANLRSLATAYDVVYMHYRGGHGPTDVRTAVNGTTLALSEVIAGKSPYRWASAPVVLTGDATDWTALSGRTGGSDQKGDIKIGRLHLGRWASPDPVAKSCAVNTLAHEMSHMVLNHPTQFRSQLTDDFAATLTSRDESGQPLAVPRAVGSYLVGTVAQCTWLQEQGYSPAVDLGTCVKVFGHRGHNSNRCTSFSGGRKIELRSDLPAEYVLVDRQ